MAAQAIIGLDIGTTGCRAVIYRPDGAILANKSQEYPLYTPKPTWAEQNPAEIYTACLAVIKQAVTSSSLSPSDIAGISFSSVFHSTVAVGADGAPLSQLLTWADSRSQKYTEEIRDRCPGDELYARTGCPLHPMYPLSKILWFRREAPEIFARAAKFISIKEFVLHRLCGKYIVDKSIASGTGMLNLQAGDWDGELLKLLDISADRLSPVLPTTHVVRGIAPQLAAELGISPDIALILGAGDGVMSSVGSGAVNPGQMTAMIGTSGAVRVVSPVPKVDPQKRTWCYNLTENHWVLGGAINNGGIALRWLRDKFADTEQQQAIERDIDVYEVLTEKAALVPPGSDGLIMLPLFTGERAPNWNANARSVLFGLNLNHGKPHIIRATLEGVMYRMFSVFSALEEVAGQTTEIRVSGSFTRSELWLQIMADVFGRTINVPGEPEGSSFGAAVLGFYALGMVDDITVVDKIIPLKARYQPIAANHARYRELFEIYQRIYRNLGREFTDITEIQRNWR